MLFPTTPSQALQLSSFFLNFYSILIIIDFHIYFFALPVRSPLFGQFGISAPPGVPCEAATASLGRDEDRRTDRQTDSYPSPAEGHTDTPARQVP